MGLRGEYGAVRVVLIASKNPKYLMPKMKFQYLEC